MTYLDKLKEIVKWDQEFWFSTSKSLREAQLSYLKSVGAEQEHITAAEAVYDTMDQIFLSKGYYERLEDKLREAGVTEDELSIYISYKTNNIFVKVEQAIDKAQEDIAQYVDDVSTAAVETFLPEDGTYARNLQ